MDYWILTAIASACIFAFVTVGDKWILTGLGVKLSNYCTFVGMTQLLVGILILLFMGFPDSSFKSVISSLSAGALWGLGLTFLFFALQREEVGIVTPIWQISPVFASVFAVYFLGESLNTYGWMAILLVVFGATFLSTNFGRTETNKLFSFPLLLVIIGAIFIGGAQVLLKQSSSELGVWHNMAYRGIGLFTTIGLPYIRISSIQSLGNLLSSPKKAAIIFSNETIGPISGNIMLLMAVSSGPVSKVSALLGTRPLWVFLLTILISVLGIKLFHESFKKIDIIIKAVSALVVSGGIGIIALA